MTFPRVRVVATAAAMIVLSSALAGCGSDGAEVQTAAAPEVGVYTVHSESLTLSDELPGRTAPYLVAEVRPQIGGILQKRFFEEGSYVEQGQPLYQVDPAPYQAVLSRTEATLSAARLRSERYDMLVENQAISRQSRDDATSQFQEAKAAALSARIDMGYTRILAPISGRIGRSSVTQGALVSANQANELATIQQLDPIYVDIVQSSTAVLKLKADAAAGVLQVKEGNGAEVSLTLENGAEYPYKGTLKFSEVSVDQGTGSVTLRAVFPNKDGILLPGMFVRAKVPAGTNEQALLVPQRTVSRDNQGRPYVLTVDNEQIVRQQSVVVDRAVGNRWLISSGIKPGDRLIEEGIQKVTIGQQVIAKGDKSGGKTSGITVARH
ncbi:efflux RND transporter periplasmic adaptor subunit [Stenotrophomonas sp. S39]|nr:efflux RND transporter periplasmic adaptor subunit [Stenotrophomonas sp. S39]